MLSPNIEEKIRYGRKMMVKECEVKVAAEDDFDSKFKTRIFKLLNWLTNSYILDIEFHKWTINCTVNLQKWSLIINGTRGIRNPFKFKHPRCVIRMQTQRLQSDNFFYSNTYSFSYFLSNGEKSRLSCYYVKQ